VIVENFQSFDSNWWITIGGFLFLFFVATTLLMVVKQAIHQIWHIRKTPEKRFRYTFTERFKALGLILFIGVLFILTLLLDTSMAILYDYLDQLLPSINAMVVRVLNIVLSITIVTIWFITLFKFLPEARVVWSVAFAGGLLTGILFNLGKWFLGQLLVYSNVATIFGASASLVLILLFIFYSSFILYYGAAFTYVYAKASDKPVTAGKYSSMYELKFLEK
jgi:membrane protein